MRYAQKSLDYNSENVGENVIKTTRSFDLAVPVNEKGIIAIFMNW